MKAIVRAAASRLGYEIRRSQSAAAADPVKLGYIDPQTTIAAAEAAGLRAGAYMARQWGMVADIERDFDGFADLGISHSGSLRFLEIGAGAGLHTDVAIARLRPVSTEIYETSRGWAAYLANTHALSAHEADGLTLKETGTASVDFTLAAGVFVYLPFLVAASYWDECCRVTAPGGYVAFDVLSEGCFTADLLPVWRASKETYPVFLSAPFIEAFFAERGLTLAGRFHRRYGVGRSEWLVFQRG